MNYSIESAGDVKKTVSFEFPESEIRERIDTYYRDLNRKITIKGFRPGKVPRQVLERKFQKDAYREIAFTLMDEAIQELLKNEGDILNILPTSALDLAAEPPFRFMAEIEVKPKIADIPYKGIAVTREMQVPTDEEIDLHLRMHQRNLTRYEKITETRALNEGDMAILAYKATENGQIVAAENDFRYTVGNHFFSADFDRAIVGMQVDETRTITVSFASDHRMEAFAGKTLDLEVRLTEIREPILPPIDDELAQKLGVFKNLDELKETIRTRLTQGYEKRAEQKMHEQIFDAIDQMVQFEVPPKMIDTELGIIVEDYKRAIQYHGGKPENIDEEPLRQQYRPLAEKQAKRHLILEKIAKQEGLSVEESEMQTFYKEMAESLGQDEKVIAQYYESYPAMVEHVRETLLEKKAMRLIVESCTITEVPADAPTGEHPKSESVEEPVSPT
ncbi:MAG: trigger factor [Thermodesulfobacteriota bacterium]